MNLQYIIIRIIDTFEDGLLIEEFTQKGSPKLVFNGADDKYQTIMTSEFSFNMLVTDMADGKFYHLYTGNEKRYKVTVHSQNDERLLWEGYLLPDFYSEPYENGSFFVELTATDGLGLLKGHHLEDKYYKQETSVMKLICECLKLCSLNKEIHFTPAFMSAATDYLWHEIVVDGMAYLDGELQEPNWLMGVFETGMPDRKRVYDILDLLLKNLGCTLYCWSNVWYIEGINRKHESTQTYHKYDLNGNFLGFGLDRKSISKVTFFKSPRINIVSPWKTVNITFDLDEEGDLLADGNYYKTDQDEGVSWLNGIPVLGQTNPTDSEPLILWKQNGVASKAVVSGKYEYFGNYQTGQAINLLFPEYGVPPICMEVKVMNGAQSETNSGNSVNFLSLKTPKYIRKSDARLLRKFDFSITVGTPTGWDSQNYYEDGIEDGIFKWMYRVAVLVAENVVKSSHPSVPRESRLVFDLSHNKSSVAPEKDPITDEITGYVYKQNRITADAEFEDRVNSLNGFADIRLMGIVPPDVNNAFLNRYVITDLSFKYTPEKEWEDSFTRDIDYTTEYDLEVFHGDTVSDLTKKNFRFRRFIPAESSEGIVEFISKFFSDGGWFGVSTFRFVISYEDYLILQNASSDEIRITYDGVSVTLAGLYTTPPGGLGYDYLWGVFQEAGVYVLSFIVDISSSFFEDINKWENVFLSNSSPVFSGWVTEDNEWREQWKRFGVNENIRYGAVMAKMYHDVQPEPFVKMEGDLKGIYNPRELLKFHWREEKKFIPTRLTLDFTTGKTQILMLESKYENVVSAGKYIDWDNIDWDNIDWGDINID